MATMQGQRPAQARRSGAGQKTAAKAKSAGKSKAKSVKPTTPDIGSGMSSLAKKAAGKAVKAAARRAAQGGLGMVRAVGEQTAQVGRRAVEASLDRRVPIQVSIDIAVPIDVVWDEWMTFESLSEGVDRIEDVERDGDELYGRIAGRLGREWVAEIQDERPCESFAWRSVQGSDCAGLVTFHELAERLTRVEVDLDVVPNGPAQAITFASRMAHRRAESELRRFKARLEFINPDEYEQEGTDEDAASYDDGENESSEEKE